ncbi:hypothetical protein T484DRAFT_2982432 [Baffinella frigidus]|nr:hypothetical protein T484DRAFT_2982432 [Cryptophyta sp. CCMP2293]
MPSWSGDRRRLMEAVMNLREIAGDEPPAAPAAHVSSPDAGGDDDSEVSKWLVSAGFGRFRQLFAKHSIHSLHEVSQVEREDLAELGVPDAGGQLGRLMAAIGGLRYTLQAGNAMHNLAGGGGLGGGGGGGRPSPPGGGARSVFGEGSARSGRLGSRAGEDDAESRWETDTVATGTTVRTAGGTKTGRSKSREGKKKKTVMEFTLIAESVETSDIYGHKWSKMTAHLYNNKLLLYSGHKKPEPKAAPKLSQTMDGLIVDASDKKTNCVFIVKSLFANFPGDMLISFKDAKVAKTWKERLQAASFFHNMSPAAQGQVGEQRYEQKRDRDGPAGVHRPAGAAKKAEGAKYDEWGNRLPEAADHAVSLVHMKHDSEMAAAAAPPPNVVRGKVVGAAAGREETASLAKGGKGAKGGGVAQPVKSFTIQRLEVRNSSTAFEEPFLACGIFAQGGAVKSTLPSIPLRGGDDKAHMRFEIGAKASVPEDYDSVLFLELRHRLKGKDQAPKYWTCIAISDMDAGRRALQLYKAPVEYCLARQKKIPKKDCTLHINIH